jgi:hypothetical protein
MDPCLNDNRAKKFDFKPCRWTLIYNTTRSGFNYYDAGWKDLELAKCYSSDGLDDISTQSNIDMKVPAMSISPMYGKYSVSFDKQYYDY